MAKIAILLILSFFLKPIFPVIEYFVNYEYISKVLCENKDIPQMHCNGKCHLMKELAKQTETEKPISSDKKTNSKQEIEVLFFQEFKSLDEEQIYFQNKIFIGDNYSNLYFRMYSYSIFHPPILLS